MLTRIASLISALVAAVLFTSCGNSDIAVLSDAAIRSGGPNALPAPSSSVIAATKGLPRDKHAMPIYAFKDRRRAVRTTAYTCSEADHLKYGSKNATGTNLRYSNRVRSAAADWSFYPVGTTFRIKGLPYLYVVDDYGSALTGTGTIDIFKPSKGIMRKWGVRTVEINIVQWGSFNRSAELLCKRTHYSHCRKMFQNIVRQRPDLGRLAMR